MTISLPKTKTVHIHHRDKVSSTTKEEEVAEMKFPNKCSKCERSFPTLKGLKVYQRRWCGRKKNRIRAGTLVDKAVQKSKCIVYRKRT